MSFNEGRQSRRKNTTAAKKPLLQHDFPGGRSHILVRLSQNHFPIICWGGSEQGAPHWACRPSSGRPTNLVPRDPQGPSRWTQRYSPGSRVPAQTARPDLTPCPRINLHPTPENLCFSDPGRTFTFTKRQGQRRKKKTHFPKKSI